MTKKPFIAKRGVNIQAAREIEDPKRRAVALADQAAEIHPSHNTQREIMREFMSAVAEVFRAEEKSSPKKQTGGTKKESESS